jgi:hypothetical protein
MHCVLQDKWLKEGAVVHYWLARRQQSILWELPTNRGGETATRNGGKTEVQIF